MLYLVIHNDDYYPCSGTTDWLLMTADEDEALAYFESFGLGVGDLYLVEITSGGVYSTVDSRHA